LPVSNAFCHLHAWLMGQTLGFLHKLIVLLLQEFKAIFWKHLLDLLNRENCPWEIRNEIYLKKQQVASLLYFGVWKNRLFVVCTYVPLSLANRQTNLHPILYGPPHQLREGSFYNNDSAKCQPNPITPTPISKTIADHWQ